MTVRTLQAIWLGAVTAMLAAGCAPMPTVPEQAAEKPLLLAPGGMPLAAPLDWSPGTGRMSDALQRRHFAAGPGQTVLWADGFERVDSPSLTAWRKIGTVTILPVAIAPKAGVEIAAPPGRPEDCSLERELVPGQLHGRDVRLELEFACPSQRRAEAIKSVRLSLVSTDAAGQQHELFLPITADRTPGWETARWWVRFGPQVGPTRLRLQFIKPEVGLLVHSVSMFGRDWPVSPTAAAANDPTTQPAPSPVNLIAGGDFETGRRMFYGSMIRKWPNGDSTASVLTLDWENEAVVGERSLRVLVGEGTGRLGFGPLDLTVGPTGSVNSAHWNLKFYARANRAANLNVELRTRSQTIDRSSFKLTPEWQPYTASYYASASNADDRIAMMAGELLFEMSNEGSDAALECLLDGVSLTDLPVTSYAQAEPIEVGITGPVQLAADLADVVSEAEMTAFEVNLTANPFGKDSPRPPAPLAGPAGKLALDVLDGWDRSVWTRTSEPVMPAGGRYAEKVSLHLPRGYYRLLATLWSGEPGQSQRISHDERAVAVVSFVDPVPLGNRFGLGTAGGCVSGYTTAIGAGWVRADISAQRVETRSGTWDFRCWQESLRVAKQANVELVAGVTLPAVARYRRPFLEQWLAANPVPPIGVVVSPPAISTRPAGEYLEALTWIEQMFATAAPQTRVVCDISALSGSRAGSLPKSGNFAIGYASTEGALPESSEPLLQEIGRRYSGEKRIWDLGVPVRLGGNVAASDWPALAAAMSSMPDPLTRLDVPPDPILSASRMVRSILIRALAGAQLVCCEATVLAPPASLYDLDHQRLHERDLTPRPALAVFERLTSILNDATLARWIDLPDGCHLLYFDKDDGGAAAVVWRPFGTTPSVLTFAGLPATVPVLDCLGAPEPATLDGGLRIVKANEYIRYIVAPPAQAALLREAMGTVHIRSEPPRTQPAPG